MSRRGLARRRKGKGEAPAAPEAPVEEPVAEEPVAEEPAAEEAEEDAVQE